MVLGPSVLLCRNVGIIIVFRVVRHNLRAKMRIVIGYFPQRANDIENCRLASWWSPLLADQLAVKCCRVSVAQGSSSRVAQGCPGRRRAPPPGQARQTPDSRLQTQDTQGPRTKIICLGTWWRVNLSIDAAVFVFFPFSVCSGTLCNIFCSARLAGHQNWSPCLPILGIQQPRLSNFSSVSTTSFRKVEVVASMGGSCLAETTEPCQADIRCNESFNNLLKCLMDQCRGMGLPLLSARAMMKKQLGLGARNVSLRWSHLRPLAQELLTEMQSFVGEAAEIMSEVERFSDPV